MLLLMKMVSRDMVFDSDFVGKKMIADENCRVQLVR
jgi:hypothetical protein